MTIKYTLLLIACLLVVGCEPTRAEQERDAQSTVVKKEERQQVAQAVANLEPVGKHLETTGRKPEGEAVLSQTDIIENALNIKPEEKPLPTVSYLEWQLAKNDAAKAEELAARLSEEKNALSKDITAEREKLAQLEKVVEEEKNSAWSWAKLGGFAVSAAGIAAWIARMLNVPGMQFIEPVIASLTPALKARMAGAERKASTATTAIMASDAGSFALQHLESLLGKIDPDLKTKLPGLIHSVTNGKAASIQDVFKMVAKGVAVDEGQQTEVDALLMGIRDAVPTVMGQPTNVAEFFAKGT